MNGTPRARLDFARWGLFGVGLVISFAMAWRGQVSGDQYYLLVRGWMLLTEGWLVPFGTHMSAGGFQPGAAASLFTGLPLFVWQDFRATHFSILLTHVVAYWLLDRSLRDVLDARGRFLLCLLYWFNPWRMYFSAHLWNPNWLFVIGAAHLWTAVGLRREPRFLYSVLHVVTLGLAFQIHASFLILALASFLLFVRGYIRLNWPGAICGGALALASLLPWILAVREHPDILPVREGFLGWGLVTVFPMVRGIGYWLRYPSLHYGHLMTIFDFTPTLGPRWDAFLAPFYKVLTSYLGPLTVLIALLANIRLWRRRPDLRFARFPADGSAREWVLGYIRWAMIAAVLSFAMSPSTIMSWQVLIVLHAAVLPVVFWAQAMWRIPRWSRWVRLAVAVQTVVLAVVLVGMSVGAPLYRKGGRTSWYTWLTGPHPMLDGLGIPERTSIFFDPEAGVRSPLLDGRDDWYVRAQKKM